MTSYKKFGWGLLVAAILYLLSLQGKFVLALIFLPSFLAFFQLFLSTISPFARVLTFIDGIGSTLLALWAIGIAIYFITKKRYTKQILYFVWVFILFQFGFFLASIPLEQLAITKFITGFFAYLFLINNDNHFSRLIQNKKVS